MSPSSLKVDITDTARNTRGRGRRLRRRSRVPTVAIRGVRPPSRRRCRRWEAHPAGHARPQRPRALGTRVGDDWV